MSCPFHPDDSLSAMIERLRHDQTVKPSDWLAKQGADQLSRIAEARHLSPQELRKSVSGDLDAIVLKSIAHNRDDRYPSPRDLAMDIERHLQHRPILARPREWKYYTRRFIRRHRVFVSASAAVALALLIGAVATGLALRRAIVAESVAATQRDSAEAVTQFLTDMLISASPEERGRDVKVRALLDQSATEIDGQLGDQPLVESRLRLTIGKSYAALGLLPEAMQQVERARQIRFDSVGPRHPATLEADLELSAVLLDAGDEQQAEQRLHETLDALQSELGPDHLSTRMALSLLAGLHYDRGELEQAVSYYEQVYDGTVRVSGDEAVDTLSAMHNLALAYVELGRATDAEAMSLTILERAPRVYPEGSAAALPTELLLGQLYNSTERFEEAELLLVPLVEKYRQAFGAEHPDTMTTMNSLAIALGRQGKLERATSLFGTVLESQRRSLGDGHIQTLLARFNLARILIDQGASKRAEEVIRPGIADGTTSLGADHWVIGRLRMGLGGALRAQGKLTEALAEYEAAYRVISAVVGDDHPLAEAVREARDKTREMHAASSAPG